MNTATQSSTVIVEHYKSPSLASVLRVPKARPSVSSADKPSTLSIPAGMDGLVHERPGVLRVVSASEYTDGTRHQHLITYAWTGARFEVLTCNCICCSNRHAPACHHCIAADDTLNCTPVKGYLLNTRAGQTAPTQMCRSLLSGTFNEAGKFVPRNCGRCGPGHPLRQTTLYFQPHGYLNILSCPSCSDWRVC